MFIKRLAFVLFFVMLGMMIFILTDKAEAAAPDHTKPTSGQAWRFEAPDRKVKNKRITYAEVDAHGRTPGMIIEFNNGSVWWFSQCKREDSRNCSWNAGRAGNRVGKSFVDLRGKVYYIPKRFASKL